MSLEGILPAHSRELQAGVTPKACASTCQKQLSICKRDNVTHASPNKHRANSIKVTGCWPSARPAPLCQLQLRHFMPWLRRKETAAGWMYVIICSLLKTRQHAQRTTSVLCTEAQATRRLCSGWCCWCSPPFPGVIMASTPEEAW
jgi:hypothetical protein